MFTMAEAIEFAIQQGFKNPNFIYVWNGKVQVYLLKDGCATCLRRSSGPDTLDPKGLIANALRDRGGGWFVSGKLGEYWAYYFNATGDEVPHG